MYYMFLAEIPNMVLGRDLLLFGIMVFVWIVDGTMMLYRYKTNVMVLLEIAATSLTGSLATIVYFVQYSIFYKFGIEKGKVISSLLYMVPAFIIFALPSTIIESNFISSDFLNRALNSMMNNKMIVPLLIVKIIGITGFLSLSLSCSICKKKEMTNVKFKCNKV